MTATCELFFSSDEALFGDSSTWCSGGTMQMPEFLFET
jgi:hypothetical protein